MTQEINKYINIYNIYTTQICQMSITFLTVNVVCFWKTSVSNSDSLLFHKNVPQYSILITIWSGQMLHLQLYVDRKLLDYVHHYNWHGPMVFFNKLFSLSPSLSLSLSQSLKICLWVLCSSLSLCSYPWRWCPSCTSNNFPGQSSLSFLLLLQLPR